MIRVREPPLDEDAQQVVGGRPPDPAVDVVQRLAGVAAAGAARRATRRARARRAHPVAVHVDASAEGLQAVPALDHEDLLVLAPDERGVLVVVEDGGASWQAVHEGGLRRVLRPAGVVPEHGPDLHAGARRRREQRPHGRGPASRRRGARHPATRHAEGLVEIQPPSQEVDEVPVADARGDGGAHGAEGLGPVDQLDHLVPVPAGRA